MNEDQKRSKASLAWRLHKGNAVDRAAPKRQAKIQLRAKGVKSDGAETACESLNGRTHADRGNGAEQRMEAELPVTL